jgi:hypothetical protein
LVWIKAPDRLRQALCRHIITQRRHWQQKHSQQKRICRTHSIDCSQNAFIRKDIRKQDICRKGRIRNGIIDSDKSIRKQDHGFKNDSVDQRQQGSGKSDRNSIKAGEQRKQRNISIFRKSYKCNRTHAVSSYDTA